MIVSQFLTSLVLLCAVVSPSWARKKPIRGVSLGGWLLAETWITPSLFEWASFSDDVKDEWTLSSTLGREGYLRVMQPHWNEFVTEEDIRLMKHFTIDWIRVPIPHWAFKVFAEEPYIRSNQTEYFERLVGWCRKHGLLINLDIHTMPGGPDGTQNGFDNSGHQSWPAGWFTPLGTSRGLQIERLVADTWQSRGWHDVVRMIGVVNEPFPADWNTGLEETDGWSIVKRFYNDSYKIWRFDDHGKKRPDVILSFSDALAGLGNIEPFEDFNPGKSRDNVNLDTHPYLAYDWQEQSTDAETIAFICSWREDLQSMNATLPVVIGEWGAVKDECTLWISGRGRGNRYDGTVGSHPDYVGSCFNNGKSGRIQDLSKDTISLLSKSFAAQVKVYEDFTDGWFYWTWKTENASEWSYRDGVFGGWIPRNLSRPLWDLSCP